MNEIQENVYNAVEVIADKIISGLEFDRTITAEISKIVNAETGEYKIKYYGADNITAFAKDKTYGYKVGDKVHVQCIKENSSEEKLITGLITKDSLSASELTQLQNVIIERSPSIVGQTEECWSVSVNSSMIIEGLTYDGSILKDYNEFGQIQVSAKFQTHLLNTYKTTGNYGIRIKFNNGDTDEDKKETSRVYTLDLNSFNGFPYGFYSWSEQSVIFSIAEGHFESIDSIELFCEDFDKEEGTEDDEIRVKDIEIKYVEVVDLSQVDYYPYIKAINGVYFSESNTTLNLEAHLYNRGRDLITEENVKCYWFYWDADVVRGKDNYEPLAGNFWHKIEEGQTDYKLKGNGQNLEISTPTSNHFKAVIVYNEEKSFSAKQRVFNRGNKECYIDFEDPKFIVYPLPSAQFQYTCKWAVIYPDGTTDRIVSNDEDKQRKLESGIFEPEIPLIEPSTIVYCEILVSGKHYDTIIYTIRPMESTSPVSVTFEGQSLFHYDADGDFNVEAINKEFSLAPTLTWRSDLEDFKDEYVALDWYIGNQKISSAGHSPTNSMINFIKTNSADNGITFTVKNYFNYTYDNNTLTLRIRIKKDGYETPILVNKEIVFVKDGDQGTNGTKYSCIVAPSVESQPNYLDINKIPNDSLQLECLVYHSGVLVSPEIYSVNWTCGPGLKVTSTQASVNAAAPRFEAFKSLSISVLKNAQSIKVQFIDGRKITSNNDENTQRQVSIYDSNGQLQSIEDDTKSIGSVIAGTLKLITYDRKTSDQKIEDIKIIINGQMNESIYSLTIDGIGYGNASSTTVAKSNEVYVELDTNPNDFVHLPGKALKDVKIQLKNEEAIVENNESTKLIITGSLVNGQQVDLDNVTEIGGLHELSCLVTNNDLAPQRDKIIIMTNGVVNSNIIKIIIDDKIVYGIDECQPLFVKADVQVTEKTGTIYLHYFYPINLLRPMTEDSNFPFDDTLPKFIQYSTNGYSPQYEHYDLTDGGLALKPDKKNSYTLSYFSIDEDLITLHTDVISKNQVMQPAAFFESGAERPMGLIECKIETGRDNDKKTQFIYYHPIIMFLNTASNRAINGWDGTSLEINDDDENAYILAPQIGAGTKDNDNKFSGVVMGKDTSQEDKTGLYGYKKGVNTFGFREDGIAYIGASGNGRIVMNGNAATIFGGACSEGSLENDPVLNEQGMIIRLTDGSQDENIAHAIDVGKQKNGNDEGVFWVNYRGKMHATEGEIGSWYFDDQGIYGEKDGNKSFVGMSPAKVTFGRKFASEEFLTEDDKLLNYNKLYLWGGFNPQDFHSPGTYEEKLLEKLKGFPVYYLPAGAKLSFIDDKTNEITAVYVLKDSPVIWCTKNQSTGLGHSTVYGGSVGSSYFACYTCAARDCIAVDHATKEPTEFYRCFGLHYTKYGAPFYGINFYKANYVNFTVYGYRENIVISSNNPYVSTKTNQPIPYYSLREKNKQDVITNGYIMFATAGGGENFDSRTVVDDFRYFNVIVVPKANGRFDMYWNPIIVNAEVAGWIKNDKTQADFANNKYVSCEIDKQDNVTYIEGKDLLTPNLPLEYRKIEEGEPTAYAAKLSDNTLVELDVKTGAKVIVPIVDTFYTRDDDGDYESYNYRYLYNVSVFKDTLVFGVQSYRSQADEYISSAGKETVKRDVAFNKNVIPFFKGEGENEEFYPEKDVSVQCSAYTCVVKNCRVFSPSWGVYNFQIFPHKYVYTSSRAYGDHDEVDLNKLLTHDKNYKCISEIRLPIIRGKYNEKDEVYEEVRYAEEETIIEQPFSWEFYMYDKNGTFLGDDPTLADAAKYFIPIGENIAFGDQSLDLPNKSLYVIPNPLPGDKEDAKKSEFDLPIAAPVNKSYLASISIVDKPGYLDPLNYVDNNDASASPIPGGVGENVYWVQGFRVKNYERTRYNYYYNPDLSSLENVFVKNDDGTFDYYFNLSNLVINLFDEKDVPPVEKYEVALYKKNERKKAENASFFYVTADGVLHCKGAVVEGSVSIKDIVDEDGIPLGEGGLINTNFLGGSIDKKISGGGNFYTQS